MASKHITITIELDPDLPGYRWVQHARNGSETAQSLTRFRHRYEAVKAAHRQADEMTDAIVDAG